MRWDDKVPGSVRLGTAGCLRQCHMLMAQGSQRCKYTCQKGARHMGPCDCTWVHEPLTTPLREPWCLPFEPRIIWNTAHWVQAHVTLKASKGDGVAFAAITRYVQSKVEDSTSAAFERGGYVAASPSGPFFVPLPDQIEKVRVIGPIVDPILPGPGLSPTVIRVETGDCISIALTMRAALGRWPLVACASGCGQETDFRMRSSLAGAVRVAERKGLYTKLQHYDKAAFLLKGVTFIRDSASQGYAFYPTPLQVPVVMVRPPGLRATPKDIERSGLEGQLRRAARARFRALLRLCEGQGTDLVL
jgi:hypothetical protein